MSIDRRGFGLSSLAAGLVAAAPAMAKPKTKPAPEPLTVTPRNPYLQWEGRTADLKDGTVRAGFPGVALRVRFHAAKLTLATMASSDTVYLDVAIDGGAPSVVKLTKGLQDWVAFAGEAGDHYVEITRRNESWQGVWDVAGASLDQGRFLAARLGTQCHLVACGGRGLTRDWQGISSGVNAPQFYERAAPDDATPLWDHQSYVPDAIGICLGTNDFSQGIPDENGFTAAFVEFVEKIRRDAPAAHIFLMDSPIVTDGDVPKRTVLGAYIDEIVRRLGSPLVSHAAVSHYAGRPSNGHPIAEDHIGIANELEPKFRAALGL